MKAHYSGREKDLEQPVKKVAQSPQFSIKVSYFNLTDYSGFAAIKNWITEQRILYIMTLYSDKGLTKLEL